MSGHFECGDCTDCCYPPFPMSRFAIEQADITNPGLFIVVNPGTEESFPRIKCTAVIPDIGCKIHPKLIGKETRPEFCISGEPCMKGEYVHD